MAGGIFGILLLLRTQSMLICRSCSWWPSYSFALEQTSLAGPIVIFIMGVFVSVAPWLTHNYLRIGKFAFDAPFQYQVLASQYAYTGNLDFAAVDLENKSLGQLLVTFALKDPGLWPVSSATISWPPKSARCWPAADRTVPRPA
jgi:hypothetical protein